MEFIFLLKISRNNDLDSKRISMYFVAGLFGSRVENGTIYSGDALSDDIWTPSAGIRYVVIHSPYVDA